MTSTGDVVVFLNDFHAKMKVFDVVFRDDRGKNLQTLADLELTPAARIRVLENLVVSDYSEGPLSDTLHNLSPMWVFGRSIKGQEVYIKISMGVGGAPVICISFHICSFPMSYPFKSSVL